MLNQDLNNLNLPDVLLMNDGTTCDSSEKWKVRQKEIVDLFAREVYGYMPEAPTDTSYEVVSTYNNTVAGFANYNRIKITFTTPKGPFSFEAELYLPRNIINVPLIMHLQFNDSPIHRVFPVEDLIKQGFATMLIRYWDVMPDLNDFSNGLAGMYLEDIDNRQPTQWGAIGAWAFAASRAMDVIEQIDCIDNTRVAIVGHSRLGKTAMWCSANDPRFALTVINGSGNTGASLSRGNTGENIDYITNHFPHWFCTNYYKYGNNESTMPFDQHEIVASIAPRKVYISSGAQDFWASPKTEFLSAVAASSAYEVSGVKGLVTPDEYPVPNTFLGEGELTFSSHDGGHYIGRFEWENIVSIMKKL